MSTYVSYCGDRVSCSFASPSDLAFADVDHFIINDEPHYLAFDQLGNAWQVSFFIDPDDGIEESITRPCFIGPEPA